jgi:hypothetical protein
MEKNTAEVAELKKIERQVSEIKAHTTNPLRSLLNGMLYGAGWVVGSVVALALLGWVLSLVGFVPGFGELANYLRAGVQHWHGGQ